MLKMKVLSKYNEQIYFNDLYGLLMIKYFLLYVTK